MCEVMYVRTERGRGRWTTGRRDSRGGEDTVGRLGLVVGDVVENKLSVGERMKAAGEAAPVC